MKKSIISMAVSLILLLTLVPLPAAAVADFPGSIPAPQNFVVVPNIVNGEDNIDSYSFNYSPVGLQAIFDNYDAWHMNNNASELSIYLECDYSYNNSSSWHYNTAWDKDYVDGLDYNKIVDVGVNNTSYVNPVWFADLPNTGAMLVDNTAYFRCRYAVMYYDGNAQEYVKSVGPWSGTVAIGKDADAISLKLDSPVLTKAELKADDSGAPYFEITLQVPDSIKTLKNADKIVIFSMEYRKTGGQWVKAFEQSNGIEASYAVHPENTGVGDDINIEASTYDVRARYGTGPNYGNIDKWSHYSNILSASTPAFYQNASSWAVPELNKAAENGLIPDILRGADMTKPITRAEFAAVSVKVFENLSGTKAIPAVNNPFTDTNNIEVLKAYNIGITTGVSAVKFAPDTLLNREQAATMLTRVFKKVSIAGWTIQTDGQFTLSYTKPAPFADDSKISSWAKDSVYFMAANGIVGGTGNNSFSPRATTPAEEARHFASATREQALAIAVRMIEKLK